MTVAEMTPDEKLDQFCQELAEMAYYISTEYKGLEKEVARLMAHQLGAYVAIVSKNPSAALVAVAKMVSDHDYGTTRAEHFGYTLGVDGTHKPAVQKPNFGQVVQLGEFKERRD